MRIGFVFSTCLLAVPLPALAQAPCPLRGVWELVSATYDGKPPSPGWHQMKIYTERHFAYLGAGNGANPMKSAADSLQMYRARSSGAGTYTVQGNLFTETVTYVDNPANLGRSFTFTCAVDGDRFTQTGLYPIVEDGRKVRDVKLEEVYRRIE